MAQQRFVLFVPETDIVELHVLDGDEASERIALLFLIALEGIENLNVSMISKVQEAYRHIPLSLKTYGGDIPVSNMYNVLSRDSECILNVGSILDVRILRLECLSI